MSKLLKLSLMVVFLFSAYKIECVEVRVEGQIEQAIEKKAACTINIQTQDSEFVNETEPDKKDVQKSSEIISEEDSDDEDEKSEYDATQLKLINFLKSNKLKGGIFASAGVATALLSVYDPSSVLTHQLAHFFSRSFNQVASKLDFRIKYALLLFVLLASYGFDYGTEYNLKLGHMAAILVLAMADRDVRRLMKAGDKLEKKKNEKLENKKEKKKKTKDGSQYEAV